MRLISGILIIVALQSVVVSADIPPQNCTKEGLFCKTCKDIYKCTRNSDGWEESFVEQCGFDEACEAGTCVRKNESVNPFCSGVADLHFPCNDVGMFPDPFYCDRYHVCVPQSNGFKSYDFECDEGYRYNPKTTYCDIPKNGKACDLSNMPVGDCLNLGDTGAVKENPVIFYICSFYSDFVYPTLHLCKHGRHFDDEDKACEK